MSFRSLSLFLPVIGLLVLSSCNKRYWYRIKIDVFSKSYTPVKIRIDNRSPERLDKSFEQQVRKACIKQLRKEGFVPSVKDSPQYEFVLVMKVDTFSQMASMRKTAWASGRFEPMTYIYKSYNTNYQFHAPAVVFECSMNRTQPALFMWSEVEDLYFLNSRFRNILRSKGMVKYMIRTASRG